MQNGYDNNYYKDELQRYAYFTHPPNNCLFAKMANMIGNIRSTEFETKLTKDCEIHEGYILSAKWL